jgi:hypothetical protein
MECGPVTARPWSIRCLERRLIDAGMTQRQAAKALGVGQTQIRRDLNLKGSASDAKGLTKAERRAERERETWRTMRQMPAQSAPPKPNAAPNARPLVLLAIVLVVMMAVVIIGRLGRRLHGLVIGRLTMASRRHGPKMAGER